MVHEEKNYDHLIGKIPGLSGRQLLNHFELYRGYVKKWNEIEAKLKTADPKTANYSYSEISELLRRSSVAWNGAYLHELYFENLTGSSTEPSAGLKSEICRNFGSMEGWYASLRAGLISEPGWVLLVRSKVDGLLRNNLIAQHHLGVLAGQDIILAIDGWEHAYFLDYGTRKSDYIEVVQKSIDWNAAERRFQAAESD